MPPVWNGSELKILSGLSLLHDGKYEVVVTFKFTFANFIENNDFLIPKMHS